MSATERQPSRKPYDLEADFKPILDGKKLIPNFEELPLAQGIANIAAGGGMYALPGINNAKIPGNDSSWGHWARYFLNTGQGGGYDGTGYVIWYDRGGKETNYQAIGRVARFAICKHEKVEGPGANHSRGWHPGYCGKCGLDMSVDSGD